MIDDHRNFRGVPPESEEGWQRIHLTQHEWGENRQALKEMSRFWDDGNGKLALRGLASLVNFSVAVVRLWPYAAAIGAALAVAARYPGVLP